MKSDDKRAASAAFAPSHFVTYVRTQMKRLAAVACGLTMTMAVVAEERPPGSAELVSIHGTMITMISENEGLPCEIWAKGNNVRTEFNRNGQNIITIQVGDTMYTYAENLANGNKTKFAVGLASMGLVQQIAEVRLKGERQSSREIEGVMYDEYFYSEKEHQEWAMVHLARKTSLPSIWISAVKTGDKKGTAVRIRFQDMKANVEVPDDLFKIPIGVTFSEVPVAELIATAQVVGGGRPPTNSELKSLHGTILERVGDGEDQQSEIWAKDDKVRAVHTAQNRKTISIQIGPTLYRYVEGSSTGSQQSIRPGLCSMGLINRIQEIKSKGTNKGSQEIEGAEYVKYTYDFDSFKESGVVYLSAQTSLPGLWIGKETTNGKVFAQIVQYREMEANVDIADDLFMLPRGVTFAKAQKAAHTDEVLLRHNPTPLKP